MQRAKTRRAACLLSPEVSPADVPGAAPGIGLISIVTSPVALCPACGQLSKSKLTFPSCSFRRALNGWPDFDRKPFKIEVFPSRSSAFTVRPEIRLADIVFQIVKPQPSRQRLQLNDFFCSTTSAPQSGHAPSFVELFSSIRGIEPFAVPVLRVERRLDVGRPTDFLGVCSSP